MSAMQTDSDSMFWGAGEPSGKPLPPDEYANEVRQLVAESAPRLFAIIQEWGENHDARIAAWGLASADRTHIVGANGNREIITSIRLALRLYAHKPYVTARVHWLDNQDSGQLGLDQSCHSQGLDTGIATVKGVCHDIDAR